MARRLYITEIVFHEQTESNASAILLYTPDHYVVAERNRLFRPGGKLLVIADLDADQHDQAVADPRIQHLPMEKVAGRLADDADLVRDVPAATRQLVSGRLEALGVDLSDVAGTWTIMRFLRTVRDRIVALQAADIDAKSVR